MYSDNFGFGLGFFFISRTFNNRMKGLYIQREREREIEYWRMFLKLGMPPSLDAMRSARSGRILCPRTCRPAAGTTELKA